MTLSNHALKNASDNFETSKLKIKNKSKFYYQKKKNNNNNKLRRKILDYNYFGSTRQNYQK